MPWRPNAPSEPPTLTWTRQTRRFTGGTICPQTPKSRENIRAPTPSVEAHEPQDAKEGTDGEADDDSVASDLSDDD